jgi:hypothetical protein
MLSGLLVESHSATHMRTDFGESDDALVGPTQALSIQVEFIGA